MAVRENDGQVQQGFVLLRVEFLLRRGTLDAKRQPVNPALIFDCDGTLADTMPAHYQAWQEVLEPMGMKFPLERFYAMGGMPTDKIVVFLANEAEKPVDVDALVLAKSEAFVRKMSEIRPIEKVVEIARRGRGRQQPMAVASGGTRPMVEMTLAKIGVLDWFSVVVTAEDTVRHKPEPDVFLEAARRLGVPAAECIVYEDTDLGLEAARRAGMRGVDIRLL
jgi:beta-phosphoglucomutase-like phosphatase (HAD superfamily)